MSKNITNFSDKELDYCCNVLYNRLRNKFDRNISKFGIYTIRNVFNIDNLSNLTSNSSTSNNTSTLSIDLNSNTNNNLHLFSKDLQNKIITNNYKANLIQEKKKKLKELKEKYDQVYCKNVYSENLVKNIRDFSFQYNILMQEYQNNINEESSLNDEKSEKDSSANPLYYFIKNIHEKKIILKELNNKAKGCYLF